MGGYTDADADDDDDDIDGDRRDGHTHTRARLQWGEKGQENGVVKAMYHKPGQRVCVSVMSCWLPCIAQARYKMQDMVRPSNISFHGGSIAGDGRLISFH